VPYGGISCSDTLLDYACGRITGRADVTGPSQLKAELFSGFVILRASTGRGVIE
jgi:hypothetical protein